MHSPTPKTQDSETIQSRSSESISPNTKQLLKLNNPPPSKFTIPSPHLKGIMLNGKSSKSTFKLRFDDLADMPEKDQDSEMSREEKIAFERSLIRKAHEEQRRKRIREKQERKREREARRQELGHSSVHTVTSIDNKSESHKHSRTHKRHYTEDPESDDEINKPQSKRHKTEHAE